MNSNHIRLLLRRHIDRSHDIGVFPRDRIKPPKKRKCAYVWNTDTHTGRGQHWVAVYIDEDGVGYYFDPYGLYPRYRSFINFLRTQCTRWIYNDVCIQPLFSKACGPFCVYFLLHMSLGWTLEDIVDTVTESKAIHFVLNIT